MHLGIHVCIYADIFLVYIKAVHIAYILCVCVCVCHATGMTKNEEIAPINK
jgi:hypothetical protein